ncbi:MAG: hypothetical protein OEW86_00320 [Nitrosopumilus sp.]|nr:hypothetical protein [Nitrosopumilus sp.]MDH5416416.1 hypothetical protein [Nitrosopumilus sp.]
MNEHVMNQRYNSFLAEIYEEFPALSEIKETDVTDHNILWTLEEWMNAGHVRYTTSRKDLYRISILLENYAVKHNAPLLAAFETEKRFKYVEDRYIEILEKIPKAWIIGNFNNPFLQPQPPRVAEVISCDGTNISDMWIVVTRGPNGPFGLVAEDMGDGKFSGFFSISTQVIQNVINKMNQSLRSKIDFIK